jgi:hypothetical protein
MEDTVSYIVHLLQLAFDQVSGSRQCSVEQLSLTTDDHASTTDELEVGRRPACIDLAKERARGAPNMNTISYTGIDVTLAITVNSCGNYL